MEDVFSGQPETIAYNVGVVDGNNLVYTRMCYEVLFFLELQNDDEATHSLEHQ